MRTKGRSRFRAIVLPVGVALFLAASVDVRSDAPGAGGRCADSGDSEEPEESSQSLSVEAEPLTPERIQEMLRVLREKLSDWNSHPKRDVRRHIGDLGDNGVADARDLFIAFLRVPSGWEGAEFLASTAALALGHFKDDKSREALVDAVDRHSSPTVLSSVAVGLGNLSGDEVVPPLERLVRHGSDKVRYRAIHGLAQHCSATTTGLAAELLSDPASEPRAGAVRWWCRCGGGEAVSRVSPMIRDPADWVQSNVLKCLCERRSRAGCAGAEDLVGRAGPEASSWLPKYLEYCRQEDLSGCPED